MSFSEVTLVCAARQTSEERTASAFYLRQGLIHLRLHSLQTRHLRVLLPPGRFQPSPFRMERLLLSSNWIGSSLESRLWMIQLAPGNRTDNPVVIRGKAASRRLAAGTRIGIVRALANATEVVPNRISSCLVAPRRAVLCRNPTLMAGIIRRPSRHNRR